MKNQFALFPLVVVFSLACASGARADGKSDYAAKCALCHGADGKGKAAMAVAMKVGQSAIDLTKSGVDCVKVLNEGKGKMPSFKGRVDIRAVCAALPK